MPDVVLPPELPRTIVLNKIDLVDEVDGAGAIVAAIASGVPGAPSPSTAPVAVREERNAAASAADDVVALSARTGEGMDALRARLLAAAGHDGAIEGVYLARRRHLEALGEARAAALDALERLRDGVMPELAAEELRRAQHALDRITGRFDVEDLLGRIFADFCVGK